MIDPRVKKLNTIQRFRINEFACYMYALEGYNSKGMDFSKATHPREVLIYKVAVEAYFFFKNPDQDVDGQHVFQGDCT